MTANRLLSPRSLATGGAVLLAVIIGVAILLRQGDPACAAAGAKATFYDLGGGIGHCSFPSAPADDLFVALGDETYDDAAACGSYLDVTGPKGKVRVKVLDSCPECDANHLDLSRTAFKKIADEVTGVVPISFKKVQSPRVPGPLSVRIKEGASRFWFAALIDNHANPLTSVKVSSGGGSFKTAHRADFNYWIIDGGAGSGPFTIKITDEYGKTTTVDDIRLKPGVTQRTGGGTTSTTSTTARKPVAKKPAEKKPPTPSKSPEPAPITSAPTAPATESTEAVAAVATEVPALTAKACG